MKKLLYLSLLLTLSFPAFATTWFVRQDGGTRYSADLPYGGCNGTSDAAYPGLTSTLWWPSITYASTGSKVVDYNGNYETVTGAGTTNTSPPAWPAHGSSGVTTTDGSTVWTSGGAAPFNQNCAYNDVRYMWMTGAYSNEAWVMAGGDTLVIRGCAASPIQQNPDAPHCRIGTDTNMGPVYNGTIYNWCAGPMTYGCSIPPPPAGSVGAHTKILGACAYGTYTCNPVQGYPYTSNLSQIFGGFDIDPINLHGANYLDIEGIEFTSHNGACTRTGSPQYPSTCSVSPPLSDQAQHGINMDSTTTNLLLHDVYIHGFGHDGLAGGNGVGVTLSNVIIAFNNFSGWDSNSGFASNATLTQSYVTMIGNGCMEQYPITNPQFPALACWDDSNAGFGDAWSGGTSTMDTFTCDHCYVAYNMKDGMIGPHVATMHFSLTNSKWEANGGQSWKMSQPSGSTGIFTNNLILGNCYRLEGGGIPPGANAALASHLYLGDACRGSATIVAYNADSGSTVEFGNNTIVTYMQTIWQIGCNTSGNCASLNYNFHNNLYLGYTPSYSTGPVSSGQAPAIYFNNDSPNVINFVGSHNLEFGVRNGDACAGGAGINGNTCQNPLLISEPAQGSVAPTEAALDGFDFHLGSTSPAIATGTTYSGQPSTDFYGSPQTTPLTIGAVVQGTPTAAGPTLSPGDGYSGPATTISITTGTISCSANLVYNTTGTTSGGNLTGTTSGTSYSLTATGDLYAQVQGCPSYLNSSITHGHYTVVTPAPSPTTITGSATITGSFSIQ